MARIMLAQKNKKRNDSYNIGERDKRENDMH